MSIDDELPKTKDGLLNYYNHAERTISDCKSKITQMRNRRKFIARKMFFIDEEKAHKMAEECGYRIFIVGEDKVKLEKNK